MVQVRSAPRISSLYTLVDRTRLTETSKEVGISLCCTITLYLSILSKDTEDFTDSVLLWFCYQGGFCGYHFIFSARS